MGRRRPTLSYPDVEVEEMRRRRVGWAVITVTVVGAAFILWWIRPVLIPFLLAVAVAYMVAPLVNRVVAWGVSRGWAILGVYAVLALLIGLGVWKLVPGAAAELYRLSEAIPAYSTTLRELVADLKWQVHQSGAPTGLKQALDTAIREVEARSTQMLTDLLAMGNLRRIAEGLISLIIAPFIAFYLLKDMDSYKRRLTRAIPKRYRQDVIVLLRGIDEVLAGFVRGQILLSIALGALATAAAYVLGLRYALLLGLFAGLMEMVPYVGPILGAIPAVLAGLSISPLTALQVVIAFAIIQQIENSILSPKLMGDRIGLHPLAVMLVLLGSGYLFGIWGLLLSLPVAGIARVIWEFGIAHVTAPQQS